MFSLTFKISSHSLYSFFYSTSSSSFHMLYCYWYCSFTCFTFEVERLPTYNKSFTFLSFYFLFFCKQPSQQTLEIKKQNSIISRVDKKKKLDYVCMCVCFYSQFSLLNVTLTQRLDILSLLSFTLIFCCCCFVAIIATFSNWIEMFLWFFFKFFENSHFFFTLVI